MGKPIPWPEPSWGPYQEITKLLPKLDAIVQTCQEGSQERNKELVRRLLRLVYDRARRIEEACLEITRLLPKVRKGREPKWYQITMDVQALAGDVISLAEDINQSLRSNEFIYIDTLLKCIKTKVDKMSQVLGEHPQTGREAGLAIWVETVNEALNDFD